MTGGAGSPIAPGPESPWRRAASASAVVAGAFLLAVTGLLVYAGLAHRSDDVLNSRRMAELRLAAAARPDDADLREQVRAFDQHLRQQHLRFSRFARWGVYLLAAGAAAFLAAVQTSLSLQKRLPVFHRGTLPPAPPRVGAMARWSVAVLAAVSVGLLAAGGMLTRPPQLQPESAAGAAEEAPPLPEGWSRNWPVFRGPTGNGVAAFTNVPTDWDGSAGRNILWKSPVPLSGENSPVVWGRRVFATGATGEKREVYCFDGDNGELLWTGEVSVPGGPVEPPSVLEDTGYAAPTCATDGQRVYAMFANGDVAAFDLDGRRVWARNLGLPKNTYGHAASLAYFGGRVLVQFDQGSGDARISALLALDGRTGKTAWRTPREVPNSWSSPLLADTPAGWQLVTCAEPWVIAYDPAGGFELWRAKCLAGDVAPTPVYADGLVFAVNDRAVLAAIRTDGSGDVTETHIAWSAEYDLPDICSPLTDGRRVWVLTSTGRMTCYAVADGRRLWEHDFRTTFRSSPTLLGDRLLLLSETGAGLLVAADDPFRLLGRTELGEPVSASAAVVDGRMYIRGREHLFCIARTAPAPATTSRTAE